jgi:DNA-binding MarR family transcriptional regulator
MADTGTNGISGPGTGIPPKVLVVAALSGRDPVRHYQDQPLPGMCQYKTRGKVHVIYLVIARSRAVHSGSMSAPDPGGGTWTLLTGHGHVLVEITRNPEARIRDISPVVSLTERSVQAIVADLEAAGYLTRARAGRRVVYTVNRDSLFRHSAQEGHRVGPFLDLLAATETDGSPSPEN